MSDSHDRSGGEELSLERIRQLAQLMEEHDLSELELRQQGKRLRLRRGQWTQQNRLASLPSAVSQQSHAAAETVHTQPKEPVVAENIAIIKSPMVGTFYSRPNPDAQPFVKVGDHVGPDSIVCIIEAMKVFNEIPAEVSGRVLAILVDNEEPVEYGKPLMKIDTSS